ncbi:putative lipoprotein [Streptomyces roseolilacinus]|uniref:Lipoprotein n=2 Tax=Streptomyces roseolilacinus TaxID=66904 RepID=A0A918B2G3_9ACTN|nr:putative lipoprotein [Streptomyces roseolilacinus]
MVTALTLAASGCMTVHGELAVVPTATRDEARQALKDFTEAYNAADKAYDPTLDAHRVTGSLGAINQAGLKARSVTDPDGNPRHRPLELDDARLVIPRKAGWPRWFVADVDSNTDTDGGQGDNRWLLLFVREGADRMWEAAHLTVLAPDRVPAFRTDADGWAEPAPADGATLAAAPRDLSRDYAAYLKSGEPKVFADGPHTSQLREQRAKISNRPGLSLQFADQELDTGAFAPVGLVTEDGGAMVFFSNRIYERATTAHGYRPRVTAEEKPLLTGEVRNTLTKEWVTSLTALVKPGPADTGQVTIVNRVQGVTSLKGS